jgi:hypothetical protein
MSDMPDRIWAIKEEDGNRWSPSKPAYNYMTEYVRVDLLQRVPDEKRLAEIRDRVQRLEIDAEELREIAAASDVERAYELTIKDLLDDIRYLLQQPPAASERCEVSVTGRHRINAPYCKDCGKDFPATGATTEHEAKGTEAMSDEELNRRLKFTCPSCGGNWRAEDAKNCHGVEPCTRAVDCAAISHWGYCKSHFPPTAAPPVETRHNHRWVGRGEYGDTASGYMCADCGVDLDDTPVLSTTTPRDAAREVAQKIVDDFRYSIAPTETLRFMNTQPLVEAIAAALPPAAPAPAGMGLHECNKPAQGFNADREKKVASQARAQAIAECVEAANAVNPELTFGSANGSMMKKCIVSELESLAKGEGEDD